MSLARRDKDKGKGIHWPWEPSRSESQSSSNNIKSSLPSPNTKEPTEVQFIVEGRILRPSGQPYPQSEVKVVDVDLRSEQVLGRSPTNSPDGYYSIKYYPSQFKRAEASSADLKVYVYASTNRELPVATSAIVFNAPQKCTIDVVVGGDAVIGSAEFDHLGEVINPLLDGAKPSELGENDITFLVGETGLPKAQIQFFTLAYQAQVKIKEKIDVDIFYGLFRKEVSTDLTALLSQDPVLLKRALSAAVSENIIRTRSEAEIDTAISLLQHESISQGSGNAGTETSISLVLKTVLPQPSVFVSKLANFNGDTQAFWSNLNSDPDMKGQVPATQLAIQLGALTLSHAPLMQELQKRKINSFSDLTDISHGDWITLLQKPGVSVPPEIPGSTTDEKQNNYVNAMMRIVEDTYPAKYFASRISEVAQNLETSSTTTNFAGQPEVAKFLQNNVKTFDFTKTRFTEFVDKNRDSIKGIDNPDLLTQNINSIQRIFAIAPRYDQTMPLISRGVLSAMQISRMGQSAFINQYSSLVGGEGEAVSIFERAERSHAMAFSLIANYGWPGSRFNDFPVFAEPDITATAVAAGIPDMSTLFGSLDVCACDECRSVDGPAAYLVDILHYLNDRKVVQDVVRDPKDGHITSAIFRTKVDPKTKLQVPMSVKDALFLRRPDIGEIELNCQNTNTPLPYIDLTIEVLENAISPLADFKQHDITYANALSDLNSMKLSDLFKNAFKVNNEPALSDFATITVMKENEWWTVDELAYTYTVRRDDGQTISVVSRNTQTKGTAAQRAANPQYINVSAYDKLKVARYPWTLPFDMWVTTVRTYLAHVDIRRWELMETLSPVNQRLQVLTNDEIAHERLGLTVFEAAMLTAESPSEPWVLWGFPARSLDTNHGIPDPADKGSLITGGIWNDVLVDRVDVFLRQSGLTYKELLNIIQLSEIFGIIEDTLNIREREGAPKDTCILKLLQVTGAAEEKTLVEIVRFGRLLRKINAWKVLDLGKAIRAARGKIDRGDWFKETGLKALLVSLSHVLRLQDLLPDLDFEVILALISTRLDTSRYKDYEDDDEDADTSSFYTRVFRNRTVLDRPDKIFTDDPSSLTGKIADQLSSITAALNIGTTDCTRLIKYLLGDDPVLSLDNLSILYRHTVLSQGLGFTMTDYLVLLKLYPSTDIFQNTAETILFIERSSSLLPVFTLTELNYILRHDFSVDNPAFFPDDALSLTLSDLRSGLQRINLDNTFTDDILDDNGDITQKKLSALAWDPKVISQIIAVFKGGFTWTVPIASAVQPGFELQIPEEIRGQVTYDASNPTELRLSFSGVMMTSEQTALKAIAGATDDFKSAVDALFAAPRTFLKRNMRRISIHDYQQPLAALPDIVKIPSSMSKKVWFDSSTSMLHVLGVMTESEEASLLDGTDPVVHQDYRKAVDKLFTAPDAPISATEGLDAFLSDQDISDLFDNPVGPGGDANTPLKRFTTVLQKLLPDLKRVLGQQYVIQKLAEYLGIEAQITERLLNSWLQVGDKPLMAIFQAESFAGSSSNSKVMRTAFKDQFVGITKIAKVSMLVQRLKLSQKQLRWIFEFRKLPSDPTAKWLDFDALPLEAPTKGDFEGWERISALVSLRDKLPLGEQTLDAIFNFARKENVQMTDIWADIAKRTNWSLQVMTGLVGTDGLGFLTAATLQDEVALTRIRDSLSLLQKIGSSAPDGLQYAKPEQTELQARTIVQNVKSKYDLTLWQTVARPLRNILRDSQRQSLVSYLLAYPPPDIRPIWRNANDLYAYYLMDVEMGPCQLTSRIKQAISITQLFVQRCLMNLEPDVKANSEYDARWEEWKTLKSFRITSAGRQIFQRPENFLEGSSRDDKTGFFKDLETELKQGDLNTDTAEKALTNYLEKLDEVANLEVMGFYHQLENDLTGHVAVNILHVFARTRATPSIYFYRTLVDGFTWTQWEKVTADISGEHIIPVVWQRRVHLFWAVIVERQEKSSITLPSGTVPLPVGDSHWEIKLAWTEKKDGKWLAKTISDDFILCWKSGRNGVFDELPTKKSPGRTQVTFKAYPAPDSTSLLIYCLQDLVSPHVVGYFLFDGLRGNPTAVISEVDEQWRSSMGDRYVMEPTNTQIKNMRFAEIPGRNGNQFISDGKLWLYTQNFNTDPLQQEKADLSKNKSQVAVLTTTPDLYSLIPPHQDDNFSCQRPFFFLHGTRSFFVEPTDMLFWIPLPWFLGDTTRVHPGLLDPALWKKYLEPRPIPGYIRPYPGPEKLGKEIGRPSFNLGSGLPLIRQPVQTVRALRDTDITLTRETISGSAFTRPWIEPPKIDISRFKIPTRFPWPLQSKHFRFRTFYHPYVGDFIRNLNKNGVDGLLQRNLQLSEVDFFEQTFNPDKIYVSKDQYPSDDVDFDNGPLSIYNWELFFHVPLMIAEGLSKNQKFAESQKWFHYIFDPTDTTDPKVMPSRQKYWRTKPFFRTEDPTYEKEAIENLMRFLASRGDPAVYAGLSADDKKRLDALEEGVRRWRKDPFNPYLVARTRTTAFQKSVVMKYLDNLIAWGDQLFRMDTIEAINEATQLFILAAGILGDRPSEITQRAVPRMQTYNTIEPLLDGFSNALVRIEELVPIAPPTGQEVVISSNSQIQAATSTMLFFCIPKNDKLLGYWDIVADRLFKIRHCMNLQGVVRELALFEPPIDPALLINAAASGADISSILGDLNAPLPYHRYEVMAAKAQDVCNELKSLGQAILSALEKKDAEYLAVLRSTHEINTLTAVRNIKTKNIDEATSAVQALTAGRAVVTERADYYGSIPFLNPWEIAHLSMEGLGLVFSIIEAATQPVTAALSLIPEIKVGAPTSIGVTFGGQNLSYSASYFGAFLQRSAGLLSKGAAMAATMGTYNRRADDWALQARLANKELAQYDKQIAGSNIRLDISNQELKNHDLLRTQASEIDDYLRDKFSNVDLYDWMLSQLSTVYFQSYQQAYDVAKKAERAYMFELGLTQPANMIQFGYWDSLKKGLLAGEKLSYSLKNMELSYTSLDRREYEVSKSVSLLQLDPVALIQLKETGSCAFGVPEALFDLDYPGHYFRRIKSVGVTIPCVLGPYTSMSSTLTLLKSSTRTSPLLSGGLYRRSTSKPDPRFLDSYAQAQDSIATSTGQNDSGMFDVNLRDEKYLPFERSGVISSWKLELSPLEISQFDVDSIQDVILHIRYTARQAGEPLRSQAVTELKKNALDAIRIADSQTGLARMFSLRHEFPDAWYKLFLPSSTDPPSQSTILPLTHPGHFPYLFNAAKSLLFTRVEFFIKVKDSFLKTTHSADKFHLTIIDESAPEGTPNEAIALIEWKPTGVLRGSKAFGGDGGKPGMYKLGIGLIDGETVKPLVERAALEEFFCVVSYKVVW